MVPKPPVEPTPSVDSTASNADNEVIIPHIEVSDVNLQEESAPQAEGKSSLADGAGNSTNVKESIKRAEDSNKTSYLRDNVVTDFPDENDSKSSRSSTPSTDKNSSEKTNKSLSQIKKMSITDDNVSSLSETDLLSTTESSKSEKPDKSEKSDVNRPVRKLISTASSSNSSSFDDSDKIMSDKLECMTDNMHLESEGSMKKEADKITPEHVPSIKLSTSCSSLNPATAVKIQKLKASPRKIRNVQAVSDSRTHPVPISRSSSGSSYKTAGDSDDEIIYEIPNLIHESSQSNEELPKKILYSGDLVAVSLPYFPTQSDVVEPAILPVANAALPQPGVLRSFKPRMDLSHGLSSGSLQSSMSADSIDTPTPPQSPRVKDLEKLPEVEGESQEDDHLKEESADEVQEERIEADFRK